MGKNRFALMGALVALLAAQSLAPLPSGAEVARQEGTPAATSQPAPAATPAAPTPASEAIPADPTPDAEPAEPADPAVAAAAEAEAATEVVTLVAWYVNDPSGDFISILPISVEPSLVAMAEAGATSIGRVEFPDEGIPTVRLGETDFDTYPRSEGDIPERWTWLDDFEGARPATLVMQIAGRGGPYDRYFGTVTFISRDEGGVGGVIVFALRPPGEDAEAVEADPAETGEPATDALEDDAAGAGASQPDPDLPDPTDVLPEPAA
jgi:hypothetical protein